MSLLGYKTSVAEGDVVIVCRVSELIICMSVSCEIETFHRVIGFQLALENAFPIVHVLV